MEVTTGLRSILSSPLAYLFVQWLFAPELHRRFVEGYVRPSRGERVFDVGCGPGSILNLLPEGRYVGIDVNPRYIAIARRRWANRAEFHLRDAMQDARSVGTRPSERFDVVLAISVLHHFTDQEVDAVMEAASRRLVPSGRLVALDPTLVPGQSALARLMIRYDRGRSIRSPDAYRELAEKWFGAVDVAIDDFLRFQYAHTVITCRNPLVSEEEPSS